MVPPLAKIVPYTFNSPLIIPLIIPKHLISFLALLFRDFYFQRNPYCNALLPLRHPILGAIRTSGQPKDTCEGGLSSFTIRDDCFQMGPAPNRSTQAPHYQLTSAISIARLAAAFYCAGRYSLMSSI